MSSVSFIAERDLSRLTSIRFRSAHGCSGLAISLKVLFWWALKRTTSVICKCRFLLNAQNTPTILLCKTLFSELNTLRLKPYARLVLLKAREMLLAESQERSSVIAAMQTRTDDKRGVHSAKQHN